MTISHWLNDITEDYITQWANKGLLRRGQKQLTKEGYRHWQLTDVSAIANIDNYKQTIDAIGFDKLQCSCPALGPCFHLTCFVLGLQQLSLLTSAGSVIDDATQVSEIVKADLLTPWLLNNENERLKALGKGHIDRALRWLNQGLLINITLCDKQLVAEVHEKESYRVIIPRNGGIKASVCSCKKTSCAHRALVVISACLDANIAIETGDNNALDHWQSEIIQQVKLWLAQFSITGLSALSVLQIDQGSALARELQQADLPNIARLQKLLCGLLLQDIERQLISSPSKIRVVLAELHAYLQALTTNPMPQPLLTLAGVHRRNYRITRGLQLVGVSVELWEALSGYSGYTAYFYAPKEDKYYTLTDTRSTKLDPNWQAKKALDTAQLGHYSLTDLIDASFTLDPCWSSHDGRLSAREATNVNDFTVIDITEKLQQSRTLPAIAGQLCSQLNTSPYANPRSLPSLINVSQIGQSILNPYQQRWQAEAKSANNIPFIIAVSSTPFNDTIIKKLNSIKMSACAIFGTWSIEDGQLILRPVSMMSEDNSYHLTVT